MERTKAEAMLGHYRDMNFAVLFSVWLDLAARTDPEAIRSSLATLFDLRKFEDAAKRALTIATDAQEAAHEAVVEVQAMTEAIGLEMDSLENRMDALRYELERLSCRNGNGTAAQPQRTK